MRAYGQQKEAIRRLLAHPSGTNSETLRRILRGHASADNGALKVPSPQCRCPEIAKAPGPFGAWEGFAFGRATIRRKRPPRSKADSGTRSALEHSVCVFVIYIEAQGRAQWISIRTYDGQKLR